MGHVTECKRKGLGKQAAGGLVEFSHQLVFGNNVSAEFQLVTNWARNEVVDKRKGRICPNV
jgi:hypothetical protein